MLRKLSYCSAKRVNSARIFHTTQSLFKLVVENVPLLGESITEGTIAEWVKSEGDFVAADDVVAIIETDKVNVEIKSPHSGVLTRKFGTDEVEVGKPLYEIDLSVASGGSSSTAPTSVTGVVSEGSMVAPEEDSGSHGQKAHIKFLGKRDHIPITLRTTIAPSLGTAAAPAHSGTAVNVSSTTKAVVTGTGVSFTTLQDKAWHGRPKISDAEIDAIESGGATLSELLN